MPKVKSTKMRRFQNPPLPDNNDQQSPDEEFEIRESMIQETDYHAQPHTPNFNLIEQVRNLMDNFQTELNEKFQAMKEAQKESSAETKALRSELHALKRQQQQNRNSSGVENPPFVDLSISPNFIRLSIPLSTPTYYQ